MPWCGELNRMLDLDRYQTPYILDFAPSLSLLHDHRRPESWLVKIYADVRCIAGKAESTFFRQHWDISFRTLEDVYPGEQRQARGAKCIDKCVATNMEKIEASTLRRRKIMANSPLFIGWYDKCPVFVLSNAFPSPYLVRKSCCPLANTSPSNLLKWLTLNEIGLE